MVTTKVLGAGARQGRRRDPGEALKGPLSCASENDLGAGDMVFMLIFIFFKLDICVSHTILRVCLNI